MEELSDKIKRIKEYYSALSTYMSNSGRHIFKTDFEEEEGVFAANSIDVFVHMLTVGLMDQLQLNSLAKLQDLRLLGAGCGDSRELAIGETLGIKCYGIDLDDYLVEMSKRSAENLHKLGLIHRKFDVVQGDYCKEEPYDQMGILFTDIDCFIHSINSVSVFPLVEEFSEKAKKSSLLILLGGPLITELIDPVKYGLSMSKLYQARDRTSIQNFYVFLRKD